MSNIKGTKTEKTLLIAFAGESQARNRYGLFAASARKEGYQQIGAIFDEIADQERMHAKRFFGFLEGGEVEVTASFPAGVVGSTEQNLAAAASGERFEHERMYPEFARIAREEGFVPVAQVFEFVAVAEAYHQARFELLLQRVRDDSVLLREKEVGWRCRKCGYLHLGSEPPESCPACKHPRGYFEAAHG